MKPLQEMTLVKNNEGKMIDVTQETLQELAKMYFEGIYFSAIVKDRQGNTHIVLMQDLLNYK